MHDGTVSLCTALGGRRVLSMSLFALVIAMAIGAIANLSALMITLEAGQSMAIGGRLVPGASLDALGIVTELGVHAGQLRNSAGDSKHTRDV